MRVKVAIIVITSIICLIASAGFVSYNNDTDFIKWVDCNIPYQIMLSAYEYDTKYHDNDGVDYDFIKALAYLGTKNGNKFDIKKDTKALSDLVNNLINGKKIDDYYGDNKYYKYYVSAYTAIFASFIGNYRYDNNEEIHYGLKNYHPIPKGYWYNHYSDFASSRSYGFARKHLGHDIMGSVGTPIIAVEGGTVTEIGWNRYGGWRIGIRSFDTQRSYYYAHMRRNKPYIADIKRGDTIRAGQVIGYLGVTGYSFKENANMKCPPHLHIGMQLIFDESQYQGSKEIWIDMYEITKFLSHNRATVYKDGDDYSTANIKIPI